MVISRLKSLVGTTLALTLSTGLFLDSPAEAKNKSSSNRSYKICGLVSHYSPADSTNMTASGRRVRSGFIAHKSLPFGTKVTIRGNTYTVMDRGPYIGGRVFDIWVPSGAKSKGVFYTCANVRTPVKSIKYSRNG
ncbi:MAG: hypothetical protein ACRCXZ_06950 [Patescibacteria group bacterium]